MVGTRLMHESQSAVPGRMPPRVRIAPSPTGDPHVGTWHPPADGVLTALAWTQLDLDDVSDVCVVGHDVWLLSDKDRCLQKLGGAPTELPEHIEKPEGLAFTPEGTWLVAVDNADGEGALHVVERAGQDPSAGE